MIEWFKIVGKMINFHDKLKSRCCLGNFRSYGIFQVANFSSVTLKNSCKQLLKVGVTPSYVLTVVFIHQVFEKFEFLKREGLSLRFLSNQFSFRSILKSAALIVIAISEPMIFTDFRLGINRLTVVIHTLWGVYTNTTSKVARTSSDICLKL